MKIEMNKKAWNWIFIVSIAFAAACMAGFAFLISRFGNAIREMPIGWLLLGGCVLGLIPAYVSYYQTTWKEITGGSPSLFVIVMFILAALGILVRAISKALLGR